MNFIAKPLAEEYKRRIATAMYQAGCLKFGDFTLASGQRSPYYCDARVLQSHPDAEAIIADAFAEALCGIRVDRMVGVPDGAVPMATLVRTRLGIAGNGLRKEAKDHGVGKRVTGDFEKGMTVCILDDVITSGGSVVDAQQALATEGLVPVYCAINVDREQGGFANLDANGISGSALLTISEALEVFREEGLIPVDFYAKTSEYLQAHRPPGETTSIA